MWRERKEMEEQEQAMSLWKTIKEFFRPTTNTAALPVKEVTHPFMVWKDTETGVYRWLAIYSNKWRDNDNPPEILAEKAHIDFVKAVDEGDWPYPEVWLWHVPGTQFGVADYVAWDDNGFALASGTVDKDKETVAESLSKEDDLFTSHGMPTGEIERDTEDSTIITRYRTTEISPLPFEAAANKHGTGFSILTREEKSMAIPENKRPFLEKHLGEGGIAALEAQLAGKAKELEEQGIEFKEEAAAVEEDVVEEPAVEEPVEEEEPKEAAVEESAPEYVTATEVAEAVGAYLKPLIEQIQAIVGAVEEQGKSLKEQAAVLVQLQSDDEAKVKAALADTPAASLFERIGSVIGAPETLIDGRSSLAKSAPEETKDYSNGPTSVGIINEFIAKSYGG
jgi:hypothetical protein